MEAWEHIAPELPPGWMLIESDACSGAYFIWDADGRQAGGFFHAPRSYAADIAWRCFGITRRAYAELIAPQRVREAAERFGELWRFSFSVEHDIVSFSVAWRTANLDPIEASGPDICTAACAAIQALGGGE